MTAPSTNGVWPDENPRLRSRWAAVGALAVYALGGVTSILCVGGLLGAIVLIARGGLEGAMASPEELITGDVMAVTFFGGFGAFCVLGVVLTFALGWRPLHALALRAASWPLLGLALLGGLIVGFLPGFIAQQLMEAFPNLADEGSLDLISGLLTEGTALEQALVVLTITIGAPFLEEFCFRGLMWNATERIFPGHAGQASAFVLTSLAFLLAHADPVQSPALIPTAFFLGWLRWRSGSIWPGVLAHFVNNTLATVMTYASFAYGAGAESSDETSLVLAVLGGLATVGVVILAWVFRRRPAATPEHAVARSRG